MACVNMVRRRAEVQYGFECGMVVDIRRVDLSMSETAELQEFSSTAISGVYEERSTK